MKSLNKTILAAAIAMAPFAANALEALDDEFLGDVTGQEGITIEETSWNTIEEFRYVDGDGDLTQDASGNVLAGTIALSDIKVGSLGVDASGNATIAGVKTVTEIDAAYNGVLITTKQVGDDAPSVNALGFADGQDISIGGIYLGAANGTQNSIGTVTIANAATYATADALTLLAGFGVSGSIIANNGNSHIEKQTLISSKADGTTGVHIVTEGGGMIQSVTYTDGALNNGTNSITIAGLAQFRTADTDDIDSVASSYATGNYIRGTRTEFDLDVEGGAVVLSNYKANSSMTIGGIYIGSTSIGSIAILGSETQGEISISAH